MSKSEIIQYWLETSARDYSTMQNLFKSGDYHWSLFMGHLVIEKLLKAIYLSNSENNINPPKTHDLTLLAEKAGIHTTEIIKDSLDLITTFNINARYPDYKQEFYKKCSKEFTDKSIGTIKEIRQWLIKMIEK